MSVKKNIKNREPIFKNNFVYKVIVSFEYCNMYIQSLFEKLELRKIQALQSHPIFVIFALSQILQKRWQQFLFLGVSGVTVVLILHIPLGHNKKKIRPHHRKFCYLRKSAGSGTAPELNLPELMRELRS